MLTVIQHRMLRKIRSLKQGISNSDCSITYFGYGANINPKVFGKRISHFEVLGVGKLRDFTFEFNTPCEYKLKGYGGILPKEDACVYGTLYSISPASLELLDCLEWVPFNFYSRKKLEVEKENGEKIISEVYIPNFPKKGLFPPAGYKELLIDSALKMSFPAYYIEFLKSHESKKDFVIDNSFNLRNPGSPRVLSPALCKVHDSLREKLCSLI